MTLRDNLLPAWVATHPYVIRRCKPYVSVLTCFPSKTWIFGVQNWFRNFQKNIFWSSFLAFFSQLTFLLTFGSNFTKKNHSGWKKNRKNFKILFNNSINSTTDIPLVYLSNLILPLHICFGQTQGVQLPVGVASLFRQCHND